MPNYKGHVIGGLVVYAVFFYLVARAWAPSHITAGEWLFFTLAGALFPDIDVKSRGQKYFYHFVFLFFILLAVRGQFHLLICCSFIIITPMLVRHRGIFHSPRFLIAMPLVVWLCASMVMPHYRKIFFYDALFFIMGALSHITLDFGLRQTLYRLLRR